MEIRQRSSERLVTVYFAFPVSVFVFVVLLLFSVVLWRKKQAAHASLTHVRPFLRTLENAANQFLFTS